MPKDVSFFLAKVAESRRAAQAAARAGFVAPPNFTLHPALEVALKHGFSLIPDLTRSCHLSHHAATQVPSSEREQIEFWWARYGTEANWFLDVREHVVSLEIDPQLCQQSLSILSGDDFSWLTTLQFPAFGKLHLLFENVEDLSPIEARLFRAIPGSQESGCRTEGGIATL